MTERLVQVVNITELVLHTDNFVIVLNKPADIAVHKTPKGDPSLEDYFKELQMVGGRSPALAHRLDKPTSGCLLLGRTDGALKRLGKLFAQGKVKKRYIAMVSGQMPAMHGNIVMPIKRFDLGRGKWRFDCAEDGQAAHTRYQVLTQVREISLVALEPVTGRTHQLRLHCKHVGCPIIGDAFYGDGEGRLLLHAFQLYVPPGSGFPEVNVSASLPDYFADKIESSGMALPAPRGWEPIQR